MIGSISMLAEAYKEKHGTFPKTWSELEGVANGPLDESFYYATPTKRYAFVENVNLQTPLKGRILMVARKPGYETTISSGFLGIQTGLKGPGRYLIYERPEGGLDWRWVKEDYILSTFALADESLPEPDREPETLAVSKARAEIIFRRVLYILVIGGPLFGLLWWRKRGRK